MKVPKKIIKKDKELDYLGKCGRLYIYQDKYGIRETFTAFDLGGVDNSEIDKVAIPGKAIRYQQKIIPKKYKIVVTDTLNDTCKDYKCTFDLANELNISQNSINTIIQNGSLYKKRYRIERKYIVKKH